MEAHHLPARHRRLLLPVLVGLFLAIPAMAVADHVFSDVADDSTHANGIHYVADAGITSGCTATAYCPGANLTRGQMATFLHRASGNAPGVPASVNAASVASDAVVTVTSTSDAANEAANSAIATCPEDTVVVGGGGNTDSPVWFLEVSIPFENGWLAQYRSTVGPAEQVTVAYARCLRVGP
jgi:hypothetical protein